MSRMARSAKQAGFTLIELMIVVAIVGVLAVLAIVGVTKFLASAKTAEATSSLGAMAKGQAAQWDSETTTSAGAVMTQGSSTSITHALCVGASNPVPASTPKGTKYQSSSTDWTADEGSSPAKGFSCLKFSLRDPQYYMYTYASTGGGTSGSSYTATANGDLNGDSVLSTFQLSGAVNAQGDLNKSPSILKIQENE